MSIAQEFVLVGLVWTAFVGSMLGLLVALVEENGAWRRYAFKELDP